MTPTSDPARNGESCLFIDEASKTETRFVAERLRAIFAIAAEIEAEYPESWDFVQGILRDEFDPSKRIPEGMDLETWAKLQGGGPIDDVLQDIEQIR